MDEKEFIKNEKELFENKIKYQKNTFNNNFDNIQGKYYANLSGNSYDDDFKIKQLYDKYNNIGKFNNNIIKKDSRQDLKSKNNKTIKFISNNSCLEKFDDELNEEINIINNTYNNYKLNQLGYKSYLKDSLNNIYHKISLIDYNKALKNNKHVLVHSNIPKIFKVSQKSRDNISNKQKIYQNLKNYIQSSKTINKNHYKSDNNQINKKMGKINQNIFCRNFIKINNSKNKTTINKIKKVPINQIQNFNNNKIQTNKKTKVRKYHSFLNNTPNNSFSKSQIRNNNNHLNITYGNNNKKNNFGENLNSNIEYKSRINNIIIPKLNIQLNYYSNAQNEKYK